MKRSTFLRNLSGLSLLANWGCRGVAQEDEVCDVAIREGLAMAWQRSMQMSMVTIGQMPPEFFAEKYQEGAMSFAEQWRHCIIYTCGQLASKTGVANPFGGIKLPVQMPKDELTTALKDMYAFVQENPFTLSTDLEKGQISS